MNGDRSSATLGGDYPKLFDGRSVAGLGVGELLDRFVERRDESAFEAMVTRLGPMVLGVCRRMLSDPHDVDDAFQATFLVLVRRAGTIRNADVVATWLYEVAVRVARQARHQAARRSAMERVLAVQEARESVATLDHSEVREAIDEEIARLPEHHRRAVVLCDVEGLSREEAAERLGWTSNMVRGRLDRARGRLRDRLTRRGLAPSGAWLALAAPPMAPRPALIAMTVRAGLGAGAVPASVLSMVKGVGWMLILSKAKLAAALMLSAAVVISLTVPVAGQKPAGRVPDAVQIPEQAPKVPKPSMDGAPEAVAVKVSGVVSDVAGQPVAGATVRLVGRRWIDVPMLDAKTAVAGTAMTDADGFYGFTGVKIPTSRFRTMLQSTTPFVEFRVVVKAPGQAIGWHEDASMYAVPLPDPDDKQGRLGLNSPVEMDVTLRPEAELKGRVVDEAGKPVPGVKVAAEDVNLLDEKGVETRHHLGIGPELVLGDVALGTTDADGRFRLPGLPSESCCWLFFRRDGSKSQRVLYASTSAKVGTVHEAQSFKGFSKERHQVYPADMKIEMPTTRRLDIRVVALDDGQPLAGINVQAMGEAMATGVSAYGTTDVDGKISFDLPAGQLNGLCADPPQDVDSRLIRTYLRSLVVTPEPANQSIELKMKVGVEIFVEVVDADSGKGIPDVRFELVSGAKKGGLQRLQGTHGFNSAGATTGADGKLRTIFDPARKATYRIRVVGVGTLDPESPPEPGRPHEALPYVALQAQSDPFTPEAGKPVTIRFVLKKR